MCAHASAVYDLLRMKMRHGYGSAAMVTAERTVLIETFEVKGLPHCTHTISGHIQARSIMSVMILSE